jgi:transposase-like protein
MSRNPIPLQKGLSRTAFLESYGTEGKCDAAVMAWRWPNGLVCPHCGGKDHAVVGVRRLLACHGCRRQISLKSGTIFSRTLRPLTTWVQGIYLITQSKNSISGRELARQLGVRPDAASLMRHKLMSAMKDREASRKLDGRGEIDDAVYGGETHEHDGGKRGRNGPNKVPFVIAIATRDQGHPQRLLLHVVRSHDGEAIEAMVRAHLEPTARIVSDGLGCFRAATRIGCTHTPIIAAKTGWSAKIPAFRWGNTVLGNVKTAMVGTM